MKPTTITILTAALVAAMLALAAIHSFSNAPSFLVSSDHALTVGDTTDLWGPSLRNGRYEITASIPSDDGFRIYGRRIGSIPWAETCTVLPAINGDGFTVRYEDEGRSYYIWTTHSPKGD